MYWPGDSRVPVVRRRFLSLGGLASVWREEVLCGYRFGIPLCCIAWYMLTVYLCLLTRNDMAVLPFMFGKDGWERFEELDYYRCPICRNKGKVAVVAWREDL